MSKKRIEAKEWKRKKKQQKYVQRLIIAAACTVAVLGVGFIGWDMWSRTYVMTFEGQRISANDMRFFTMFADGTGDPRQQALDNLTQYLLIDQAARRRNISLTAEEWTDVEESAQELMAMFEMFGMPVPNISNERLVELMSVDLLTERLMELYTVDLTIDEAEFESALEDFLINHRVDFMDMDLRFLHVIGMETANEAFSEFITAGPDEFDDIILRFTHEDTGIPLEELDVPTITLEELRQDPSFEPWDIHHISSLPVGAFSEPISVGEESFLIFVVDDIHQPSDEELSEIFREEYELMERRIAFSNIVEEWHEAADIRINQRGVNSI